MRLTERKTLYMTPQLENFIIQKKTKQNTDILTHSLHPHPQSPSPSPSFSLDAICPPWYSDALPESRVSAFFPSGRQLPPPCIFNGHTRAADKWFLFLTGEGWLQLHRDGEWGSVHAPEFARWRTHTHTQHGHNRERKSNMTQLFSKWLETITFRKINSDDLIKAGICFLCALQNTHTHTQTQRTHTCYIYHKMVD